MNEPKSTNPRKIVDPIRNREQGITFISDPIDNDIAVEKMNQPIQESQPTDRLAQLEEELRKKNKIIAEQQNIIVERTKGDAKTRPYEIIIDPEKETELVLRRRELIEKAAGTGITQSELNEVYRIENDIRNLREPDKPFIAENTNPDGNVNFEFGNRRMTQFVPPPGYYFRWIADSESLNRKRINNAFQMGMRMVSRSAGIVCPRDGEAWHPKGIGDCYTQPGGYDHNNKPITHYLMACPMSIRKIRESRKAKDAFTERNRRIKESAEGFKNMANQMHGFEAYGKGITVQG